MPPRMTLDQAHTQGPDLVRATTERFADVVLSLTPDELVRKVPGMEWNAGEVIAHVQSVYERYTIDSSRSPDVADLARQNSDDIARLGVDPVAAVASMRAQLEILDAVVPRIPPDRQFPFHGGGTMTIAGGWGNLLGELLAHGDDIFQATGRSFTVPGPDLEITWCFTVPLLAPWLDPAIDGDASWDLVFDFGTVNLRFVDRALVFGVDVDLPALDEHHTVEVTDTAAFTLAVPYRRRPPQDRPTALLVERFVLL